MHCLLVYIPYIIAQYLLYQHQCWCQLKDLISILKLEISLQKVSLPLLLSDCKTKPGTVGPRILCVQSRFLGKVWKTGLLLIMEIMAYGLKSRVHSSFAGKPCHSLLGIRFFKGQDPSLRSVLECNKLKGGVDRGWQAANLSRLYCKALNYCIHIFLNS